MVDEILKDLNLENLIKKSPYIYNGQVVPRVTELLSFMNEDYLMLWANSLGFKRKSYKKELEKAAFIGTNVHDSIELYLKNKIFNRLENNEFRSDEVTNSINNGIESFMLWYKDVFEKNNVEIIGMEEELICPWFGGKYDMLMKINEKIFLVDFKTSNHISYKYFMQLAAYRYMLYTQKGININGCLILQVSKKEIAYEEYALDFSIKEHYDFIELCTRGFMALVNSYINKLIIEREFYNIF